MVNTQIRVGGLGGQGVILCAGILGKAASIYEGKHATLLQSFGPEARGSACSAQLSISDEVIGYPYVKSPDVLMVLSQDAYAQFITALKPGGLVLYEQKLVKIDRKLPKGARALGIPGSRIAEELGRRLSLNIVMAGFFAGVTRMLSLDALEKAVLDSVPKGSEDLNLQALQKGYSFGLEHAAP